jgi:DNA-binding GntR family transcriptional regulator
MLNELPPGTRLAQVEIASQMGTSQAPVREAIQRLEQDGLVERQPRYGTFVIAISLDEIYEIFSIRSEVEGFAIRQAAQKIKPEQCDDLERLIELMHEAAGKDDMILLTTYDLAFHQQICEWSERAMLLKLWTPLYSQVQRFVVQTHRRYFQDLIEIANTHRPIVEVLRGDNIDDAERIIKAHIMLIWSKIEARES